ncbi:hypothetical protein B5X24_HaOG203677 [Helicoverpa armigera]|uniref:Uncharacterized protein n=1 Tax=Helicoverpa armigera TaxID=29058 RepID=A0A2W1BZ99_HELAM|nr:hypothetical protein B5X24_HaOG203677 [Helicoverpa armigera]
MTLYNKIDKKHIWMDHLDKVAGKQWLRVAEDRANWRTLGDAFVQQWTSFGQNDVYNTSTSKAPVILEEGTVLACPVH